MKSVSTTLLHARPEDLAAVKRLLAECGLPAEDVHLHIGNFVLARSGEELVGTIGLEVYKGVGLLRSLAVAPAQRNRGLARELCEAISQRAAQQGVRTLYLLTTSAAGYFRRLGYRTLDRKLVPPEIRETEQFRTLCPDTAEVLAKDIAQAREPACRNVLFLCTGNSARSILAEACLNSAGRGRFKAYSAGSHPAGKVNPLALELLAKNRIATEGLRSKSWDEFALPGAPRLDFVFTVCDNAAGEVCPLWPGQPVSAHWGVQDPAAVQGPDDVKRGAFLRAFTELATRINLFVNLPFEKLDRLALKSRLEEIGRA